MPTYAYRREDGTEIELQQSIREDALTVCPDTGQPMSRLMQAFGSPRLGTRFHDEARRGKAPKDISA